MCANYQSLKYYFIQVSLLPNLMAITVGRTYAELNINTETTEIILPENFNQSIRPGSIPSHVKAIRFNDQFNQELEPGVITDSITTVILGTGYKYALTPSTAPPSTKVYIHDFNREFAPTNRPFILYRKRNGGNIEWTEEEHAKWASSHPRGSACNPKQTCERVMGIDLWTCHVTHKSIAPPTDALSSALQEISELKEVIAKTNAQVDTMTQSILSITSYIEGLTENR